ncbi:MAG TPA: NrdJb, partial [Pseudomonas sp.]|nr:NrdJb [Pseudomonas sp.]
MTVKITQRIKGFKVVDETLERPAVTADQPTAKANVVEMDESLQRPETLVGMTYKIKSPLFEHALYV